MIGSPKASDDSGVQFNPPAQINTVWLWLVLAAAIIVGSLIFVVFNANSSSECVELYCITEDEITIPNGFDLVSYLYENQDRNKQLDVSDLYDIRVSLSLIEQNSDNRNLFLFGYDLETQKWERLKTASISEDGYRARAILSNTPDLLAVLRRSSTIGHVVTYLPAGNEVEPEGLAVTTIVHTIDFNPGPSGEVIGQLSFPKLGGALHYPVIFASNSEVSSLANIDTILHSGMDRFNHVQSILRTVSQLELPGIDIAYLDLDKKHRTSFTLFIAELANELHRQGKQLTLTLPMPEVINGEPLQINEGAYDWKQLGESADIVKIWPLRDQSLYRFDVPIVLKYLTEIVDPRKLVFTITPYASEKSLTGIRSLTSLEGMYIATRLAIRSETVLPGEEIQVIGTNIDRDEGLSGIIWQPETATVAFTYKLNGGRTVWLENTFSALFKLEYINVFSLGGVGIEDGSENIIPNLWPSILELVDTGHLDLIRPHPDSLIPQWWVSSGIINGNSRGGAIWTAPNKAGKYKISLTISDGEVRFMNDLTITIQEPEKIEVNE